MSYNICFFTDDYLPSKTGVGVSASMQAAALVEQGHHVVVLTTGRPGQAKMEVIQGVQVYRLPSVKLFGFYQAIALPWQVKTILMNHEIQIAHFHYLGMLSWVGARVARTLGIRSVYTHHMTVDHLTQPMAMRPLRPLLSRWIRRFCNHMEVTTAPSRNFVEAHQGEFRSPMRFISNPLPLRGIDTVELAGAQEVRADGVFSLLFVGRLDPEKNIPFLLRAFALAARSRPELRLRIAGDGSQAYNLRHLARELEVESKVEFLGWVDRQKIGQVYAGADAFVLPSRVETQGLVALEAMMYGKPVVLADSIVTATELVTPLETGYIVKADADEELASVLVRLASNPVAAAAMGFRARLRAASLNVSLAAVTQQWNRLYGSVLGSGVSSQADISRAGSVTAEEVSTGRGASRPGLTEGPNK
ncbi:MAG: glycosyltransferase [Bdellovibrionaceae bacterium]|nr:glycosyltransferase [Pseudobdellovibrionaceae bacterium]